MALKNLEETIVDRIQRALAKQLKRATREARSTGNGKASSHVLVRRDESTAKDSVMKQMGGGSA